MPAYAVLALGQLHHAVLLFIVLLKGVIDVLKLVAGESFDVWRVDSDKSMVRSSLDALRLLKWPYLLQH